MTDKSNVFDDNKDKNLSNPQDSNTPPNTTNVFEEQLSTIKRPDGTQMYNNVEEALKGASHAQEYIPQLRTQVAEKDQKILELQAELEKRAAVEEVVDRFTASTNTTAEQPTPEAVSSLTEDKVLELATKAANELRTNEQYDVNEQTVSKVISDKFGEKSLEYLQGKASELGSSVEELRAISRKNPAMAMSLLNIQHQAAPAGVNTSSVNVPPTDNEQPAPPPALSWVNGTKQVSTDFESAKSAIYGKYGVET
jgi:hypothetical protein